MQKANEIKPIKTKRVGRIRWILVYFLGLSYFCSFGQSPYQINWKKEAIYLGVGAASLGTGMYLQSKVEPLSLATIEALNPLDISSFDRKATNNYSIDAASKSDFFLTGSPFLPLLFLSHRKTRKDFGTISLLYVESLLLTEGITNLTKRIVKRTRPFVFNDEVDISEKVKKSARLSFFSGHTSVTANNFFFMAKVYSDYFPDSKAKYVFWGTAVLAPALTGYLRVKAGKHYPTDVMTGYLVGASIGFFIPHLHKIQKDKSLSFYPAANGMMLVWKFD